jgi:hypothetical protein
VAGNFVERPTRPGGRRELVGDEQDVHPVVIAFYHSGPPSHARHPDTDLQDVTETRLPSPR